MAKVNGIVPASTFMTGEFVLPSITVTLAVLKMYQVQAGCQLADRVHRIVSAGCEVARIGRGAAVCRQVSESLEHIFRALIRKLDAGEEVIVDGEGQPSLGDAAIDMFEQVAAGCVAGDVVRSQQFRKANCARYILLVFEGGRVVGDTANASFIQLCPRRLKQLAAGVAHHHKLFAGHLDLLIVKTIGWQQNLQLGHHAVHRERVIAERADADR